ncbi:MAG TPA: GT4 family glycosyltransferase PelF [Polyangiaceae bacterium]|nr:GT4 family glycosyltransferase PelF [Polyangiaceae bacterium]
MKKPLLGGLLRPVESRLRQSRRPPARGPKLRPGEEADVTLLLEGTYPFVSGGVSSWVHQIIRGLPEVRFGLVFIGGSPDKTEKMRYELPPNVVHLEEHYLSDVPTDQRVVSRRGDEAFHRDARALHDQLAAAAVPERPSLLPPPSVRGASVGKARPPRVSGFVAAGTSFESLAQAGLGSPQEAAASEVAAALAAALTPLVSAMSKNPHACERDFLFSELSWEMICERYQASARERSFLEYFWCVRSMHAPLFIMARAAESIPRSRAFHVISTGFAGFLGMLLSRARRVPLILTEHGIYTKERRIELLQASWIKDDDGVGDGGMSGIGHFRQMWIRFFEGLGKMTYAAADPIIALYEGNRARQIRDGADAARTRVLANGIDIARFAPLRARRAPREKGVPRVLGLIGRVVPIKDIKTFVRTMRFVASELPGTEGWIVGPEDEDPNYAAECHDLVKGLGLTGIVKFLGFQKVDDILPKLGLNVLTSISEAQPLVVLEAFAAGVPCVSSDVGCCRELIEGTTESDRALGAAGRVVKIADPEATGRAAVDLLKDEQAWYEAQRAGIARVERFYTQGQMIDHYRAVYEGALGRGASASQAPHHPRSAE